MQRFTKALGYAWSTCSLVFCVEPCYRVYPLGIKVTVFFNIQIPTDPSASFSFTSFARLLSPSLQVSSYLILASPLPPRPSLLARQRLRLGLWFGLVLEFDTSFAIAGTFVLVSLHCHGCVCMRGAMTLYVFRWEPGQDRACWCY